MAIQARMAELVDALVSNTSGSNAVPVRSRLRVQKKSESVSESEQTHSFTPNAFVLQKILPQILFIFLLILLNNGNKYLSEYNPSPANGIHHLKIHYDGAGRKTVFTGEELIISQP
jgi:hypothetical protein